MVQGLLGSSQQRCYLPIVQPANVQLFLNPSVCSPLLTDPSLGSLLPMLHRQTLLKEKGGVSADVI